MEHTVIAHWEWEGGRFASGTLFVIGRLMDTWRISHTGRPRFRISGTEALLYWADRTWILQVAGKSIPGESTSYETESDSENLVFDHGTKRWLVSLAGQEHGVILDLGN